MSYVHPNVFCCEKSDPLPPRLAISTSDRSALSGWMQLACAKLFFADLVFHKFSEAIPSLCEHVELERFRPGLFTR
jgi:hypothetical protein